jgi:hypothetical protein
VALGDLVDAPVFDNDEVFVRRFKDPETRIRILPAEGTKLKGNKMVAVFGSDAWPSELMHYNRSVPGGYFPCVQPHGDVCGGESDPNPKIVKRSRQWFFNGLDDNGVVRVYQIGIKLKELLERHEARHPDGPKGQPLSQMDYIVYHIGEGLETTYDAEKQELDPFDTTELEFHAIAPILVHKAQQAKDFYFGNEDDDYTLADSQSEPAEVKVTKAAPAKIRPAAAKKLPLADSPADVPNVVQIEAMDTPVIKEFLDKHDVEYAARAPRARLIELAIATAAAISF